MAIIPKTLHFIWAGGKKIMPDDALLNVSEWATLNPDFRIKIWVDKVTDPDVVQKYREAFANLYPDRPFENIEIVDITEANVCTPQIRYEIDHLMPNHGAGSDQLRYEILYAEGGMHIDCKDVFPKKGLPLSSIVFPEQDRFAGMKVFDNELPDGRLLLHVTPHSFLGHGKEAAGTEAMLCSPRHPKMKELADTARSAYQRGQWTYKLQKFLFKHFERLTNFELPKKDKVGSKQFGTHLNLLHAKMKDRGAALERTETFLDQEELKKRRAQNTLDLTGPGMAARVLDIQNTNQPNEFLMPHDANRHTDWVDLPPEHAGSWGAIHFVPHDRQTAIETALKAIYFEVDEMQIFNLQAHVEQIAGSLVAAGVINNQEKLEFERNMIKQELTEILARDTQRFKLVNNQVILNPNRHSIPSGGDSFRHKV